MTNCPTEDILLDYISGSLSPAQVALFESHAQECSQCGALASAQAAVWRSLDEWKPTPVSAGFNRELWRRIDSNAAEQESPSWGRWLAAVLHAGVWKQITPLAVATALVVTAFVLDHRGHQSVATPAVATPSTIMVTASEADQLERALDDIQLLNAVNVAAATATSGSNVM